jgi:glycosyltransferase involved in cell wall biosynthesis
MRKLGIFATHPIQYHVPLFRELAHRPEIRLIVYFGLIPDPSQQGIGFNVPFTWDIPLLEGYEWKALKNTARRPGLGKFTGINTPSLQRRLVADQVDIVIVTGWQALSLLQAIWACRRLKIPCLVRGESSAMQGRSFPVQLIHRMLMQAFEGYLVIGKSNRNFYRQYNVPEKALFHCPYYVDNDFFAAKAVQLAPQRAMIRKAWGIDDNRRVFLFCGKLIPKKNPLDLLKAATSAKTQGGHLHILMAGDGELRGQCEAFTTEHNLPATVLGFLNQTELPKAYVAADSLVLPSDYRETWGLVVNEAMDLSFQQAMSKRWQLFCEIFPRALICSMKWAVGPENILPSIVCRPLPMASWRPSSQFPQGDG